MDAIRSLNLIVNVLYCSSKVHCHDNNHALEDREREKKLAKKRLYIVSAVCLVFMVGEILGVWPLLRIGCKLTAVFAFAHSEYCW